MKFIFPVFCWVKTGGAETPDFGSPHREEKREAAKIMSRGFLSSNVVEGGGGPRAPPPHVFSLSFCLLGSASQFQWPRTP